MKKQDFTTHFKIEMTQDGSPSLRLYKDENIAEMMHQSGGAARETIYIYGDAIARALKTKQKINYMVLGLGLGYIELLISLLYQDNLENLGKIVSFEKDVHLIKQFQQWLSDQPAAYEYDLALTVLQKSYHRQFAKIEVIKPLQECHQVLGEISLDTLNQYKINERFHVICYDAFSSHTDSALWSEEFLNVFIEKFAAANCIFTTYACTSNLKRALKSQGFELIPKAGFDGKRDATLAQRGFKSRLG